MQASAPRFQQTLADSVAVDGVGYWSGLPVRVRFCPTDTDTGISFQRIDLPGKPIVRGQVAFRTEVPRRTVLVDKTARVDMVEHIMAALAGMGVDNCLVQVDQAEMPGVDGSSQPFVEAIQSVGTEAQQTSARVLEIRDVHQVEDEHCWLKAFPPEEPGLHLTYILDYGPGPIGRQELSLTVTPQTFAAELAAARTFLLRAEADWLKSQGVAQHVTLQDLLVFDEGGPIENDLRFPDECVRHKLLDVVGDLALAGLQIHGRIVAHRTGHRLNAELVTRLLQSEVNQSVRAA